MDHKSLAQSLSDLTEPSRFMDAAMSAEVYGSKRGDKPLKYTASVDRAKELVDHLYSDRGCAVTWRAEGFQAQIEGYPTALSKVNFAIAVCLAIVLARAQGKPAS